MASGHISVTPQDPYSWHESVLSTRSLSYLSTADALSHSIGALPRSRHTSVSLPHPPTRESLKENDSDYGLEMREMRDACDYAAEDEESGLPRTVARSHLFKLPRELRDRIYGLCLTSQHGSPVEWPMAWKLYLIQPQLLRTCKLIYDEAAPLLYTLNNITFHHPSDANMFVRAFAPPELARQISTISLHIKAQDTRLWMPYLTSRDAYRSLREDFPSLQLLNIRFRSNKWHNALTPEANIKLCYEDSRLSEIIDGLGPIFQISDQRLAGSGSSTSTQKITALYRLLNDQDPAPTNSAHISSKHKAHLKNSPTIKIVCACRSSPMHFSQLTTDTPTPPNVPADHTQVGMLNLGLLRPTSQALDPTPTPVREGEPFRGFSAIDLRHNAKSLHDPDLGSADVARTPFACKNGVLLSLEVHCLGPKRDHHGSRNV